MLDRLRAAYTHPDAEVTRALEAGRRPIRVLGCDMDHAFLAMHGFQPIRYVGPMVTETPRADALLGAASMTPRGRRLLEGLLAPLHPEVPIIITHADGEQPQIFAALRELARAGEHVPKHVHFHDELATDRDTTDAYNEKRMLQLRDWLLSLGGEVVDIWPQLGPVDDGLARLNDLRAEGRVRGSDALAAIGACAILPFDEADGALSAWLNECEDAPPLSGQRVLICGSHHAHDHLYRALEAAGTVIVAEDNEWSLPFGDTPARMLDPAYIADRIADKVDELDIARVIHLSLEGDEAAPWDVAAIQAALPDGVAFASARIADSMAADAGDICAALLQDQVVDIVTPPKPAAPKAPTQPSIKPAETRSRKSLTSVTDFGRYQRDWFAQVRQDVADGAPFAMVNANAPQEILRAFGIPFVVNQWWASIVAAKQQTRRYAALLKAHDFPTDVEAYSAQGLAAAYDEDAENAPWGGLPKPDFLFAVASSDPTAKIFAEWARVTGAEFFLYERTIDPRADLFTDWWARLTHHWDTALEAERINLMVGELNQVIALIEDKTGRTFDHARFAEVMDLVNEQEDYYRKTRDLVARTVPCPIGVVDSMPATMIPQWHRGTEWARDAAKAFYEEVRARVNAGEAACPNERIRLMFVGRGLWSDMGFYQQWEGSHGAVFVWSMYLALAADGYYRDTSGGRDPMRALASRFITMGDELRMPTWAGPWYVHEAQTHGVDAVVALQDADPFVVRALRGAGIPVLQLTADNFTRDPNEAAAMTAQVTAFIEGEAAARAAARNAQRGRAG